MPALLHAVAALLTLPYALLAAAFLLIGEMARTRGLLAAMTLLFRQVDGAARWGIYVVPLLALVIVCAGFVPGWRRVGALAIVALATTSLITIVALHSTRLGVGQWTFLLPCVAAIAAGVWLFVRAASPVQA